MKHLFYSLIALLGVVALNSCSSDSTNDFNAPETPAAGTFFSATIASELGAAQVAAAGEVDRVLSDNGNTIGAKWQTGEEVALIYTVSGTTYVTKLAVTALEDGTKAKVEGLLETTVSAGQAVQLVYPASLVDDETKTIVTTALENNQKGTLEDISNNYDYRTLDTHFEQDGTTVTVPTGVKLQQQLAICKFSLKYDGLDIAATQFTVKDETADKTYTITPDAATQEVFVAIAATGGTTHTMTLTATDGSFNYTKEMKAKMNTGKYYRVGITFATRETAGNFENGFEYVDLGIEIDGQKLCFATCNVGASSPEESGDFYAWGETEPYYDKDQSDLSDPSNPVLVWKEGKSNGYPAGITGYSANWSSYFDTTDNGETFITYNFEDGARTLAPAHDAATVNMGGKWRMPTRAEFQKFYDSCDYEKAQVNGVTGVKFTSKVNGKSVFFPVVGYIRRTTWDEWGESSHYWASNLTASTVNSEIAHSMRIDVSGSLSVDVSIEDDEVEYGYIGNVLPPPTPIVYYGTGRGIGLPVRGVFTK